MKAIRSVRQSVINPEVTEWNPEEIRRAQECNHYYSGRHRLKSGGIKIGIDDKDEGNDVKFPKDDVK
ncbi:MAG: hypothetical protein GY751_10765 [Bacteroidetes bacterium]|nr:hypothetical protein [Bacteroidota bacterium]